MTSFTKFIIYIHDNSLQIQSNDFIEMEFYYMKEKKDHHKRLLTKLA